LSPPATPPELTGDVIFKDDPDYADARMNYNERFSIYPFAIVYCQNAKDVVNAVLWSQINKKTIALRCGRHSYEAFSLVDDGIVIDVSAMNEIKVDVNKRTASVQAGASLIQVYRTLWNTGKLALSAGSCPTVGITGLTLGGGFGLLSRKYGLTCDNLLEAELVMADGRVILANKTENKDLFWVLRGGGAGSFGVVTRMTFNVHPIDEVTIAKIYWHWSDLKKVLKAWQDWAPWVDERLTCILSMPKEASGVISFAGQFLGSPIELSRLLKSILVCEPTSYSLNQVSFIDAVETFGGLKEKKAHWALHETEHQKFKNTSHYARGELSNKAIRCIIKHLKNSPNGNQILQLDNFGGAVNRIKKDATAFAHRRGTRFSMQYQAYWKADSDAAPNIGWINKFRQEMEQFISGGAYSNYCDIDIQDWGKQYYGSNFEQLIKVKNDYDPNNVFAHKQSIPLKG